MLDSIIHTDIRLFETMDILYPDPEYKDIIQPDEIVTWVDIDGSEQPMGPSSWANDMEAKTCVKICDHLIRVAPRKSVVVVSRFRAQKQIIRAYLQRMDLKSLVKWG